MAKNSEKQLMAKNLHYKCLHNILAFALQRGLKKLWKQTFLQEEFH